MVMGGERETTTTKRRGNSGVEVAGDEHKIKRGREEEKEREREEKRERVDYDRWRALY